MQYPSDFEIKLGFDQIRQKLSSYCLSSLGIRLVNALQFHTDNEQVSMLLRQNLEFKQIFERGETFPSNHFIDPEDIFKKVSLEGNYLDEPEFLQLAFSTQTLMACRDFLVKAREFYPTLFELTLPITVSKNVSNRILSIIDENGTIKDSASVELGRIRKKLRNDQGHLRKLVDQVYRHAIEQDWVPEGALPTIRDGRLVIPILAEHKRRMKGFILDESASGQTVFMEPTEVLDANNEIRDLEHAQKREVIRILKQLTDEVRVQLPDLQIAYQFLAQIDFIRAKAKLSITLEADLPQLHPTPVVRWIKARHPLLFMSLKGKREIVPLDIDLTLENRMLLVSGPNAGGKSVCLKTVGLLQYMVQCGLLIPVSPDSTVGIFQSIFIDIGDQQSIENDLSTYSSHLKNMAFFLQHATDQTLILMDELGSGTDPNFGGAIAESILFELLQKNVWGVATTHYYNLKLFAGQQNGIRNAAMRFDEKNLVPLYKLDIGKPGSSFALEIAQKTGLSKSTLDQAQQLVGKELMGFESMIRNLEKEKNELTEKVTILEKQERELKALLAKYETLTTELEYRKKEIIDRAKQEANVLLRETNKEIEKTIRHIRENQAERKETQKVRKNLQELSKKVTSQAIPVKKEKEQKGELKVGDRVRIIGQDGSGVIVSLRGINATVQFGEMRSMTSINKLEKLTGHATRDEIGKRLQSVGMRLYEKQAQFSSTLDVRGKRVEEVLPLLEQFLDTAILLSYGEVKILHGKGEGILRKVIREQLKKYNQIASLGDEHVERGGDGITVVILK